jgi:psp operon transcriptional activator
LSFEVVTLPPLRHRKGDVQVLADFYGRRMASEIGLADWPGWGPTALDALLSYDWPGNVRELRNVVERAVYRWERDGPVDSIEIDPFKSPFRPRAAVSAGASGSAASAPAPVASEEEAPVAFDGGTDFKSRVCAFEKQLLSRALAEHRFNQRSTAEALGLTYDQLRHALKRHELLGAGG